ncbi:hypothetical protein [Sphingobacterium sp. SGL-16]|uniref:hypothetical protein n=1 Tax=Sphingobacterium sp. SGL-16 TaxID=2710883 RepID=UPI0013EA6044|nr:hypothetical protein [Sphingobacterium sp. SGL-16]NGM74604.1 hypothetical protein [Sphingobacterium sp. SGL-16]
MRLLVLLGCIFCLGCSGESKKNIKESIALEEIVYQRTEGLIILDKLLTYSDYENANMICKKIKNFYSSSQPNLVGLCKDKELHFTLASYETIDQDIESFIQDSSSQYDLLLDRLLSNLNQQKTFYMQILEDRDLADLHYYTLDSYLQVVCFMDDMKYLLQKTSYTAR